MAPFTRVAVIPFVVCLLACGAIFIATLTSACATCGMGLSWYVPLLGASAWGLVSYVSWSSFKAGFGLAVIVTVSHTTLILSDGALHCVLCASLLATEIVALAVSASLGKVFLFLRDYRWWMPVGIGCVVVSLLAGIGIQTLLSADCPDEYRRGEIPRVPESGHDLIVVVQPGCSACAQLAADVLPEFKGALSWSSASRCTPEGRRLIRAGKVRSFPTLLVRSQGGIDPRASGVEDIRRALQDLLRDERRRSSR